MAGGSVGCEETRCRELSAYPLDEAGNCLRPSRSIPELQACTAHPPTRGVRTICLVDASGQLFLATTGDSERVSGSGWRYSGGAGAQALTEPETQRCAAAMSQIGFPEPRKECSISDGGAASDGDPPRDGGATTDTDVNRDRPTTDGAQIIETPFSAFIKRLSTQRGPLLEIPNGKVLRALALLLPSQIARISQNPERRQDLASLCSKSDAELDQLAHGWNQVHKYAFVHSPPYCPFFYPSKGFFLIPLIHAPTPHPCGFAIPLTERKAVMWFPAELEHEEVAEMLAIDRDLALKCSVGTNSERVVIHPGHLWVEFDAPTAAPATGTSPLGCRATCSGGGAGKTSTRPRPPGSNLCDSAAD
jgi:hypothetical protein